MGDIASIVTLTVNSPSQGKFTVTRLKSWTVKTEAKAEAITEVGNKVAAGIKRKPGALTVTFELFTQKGARTPDWQAMIDAEEWISVTKQIDGGVRDQYPQCQVSSFDENGDNEGENMCTVEVVALYKKPL